MEIMNDMDVAELYILHNKAVKEQGRKLSWIAKQLDCSYSLVHKYLNGHKTMSRDKIIKLHNLLK